MPAHADVIGIDITLCDHEIEAGHQIVDFLCAPGAINRALKCLPYPVDPR